MSRRPQHTPPPEVPASPWDTTGRSAITRDPAYRTVEGGKTLGQARSEQIARARRKGQRPGYIPGMGKQARG